MDEGSTSSLCKCKRQITERNKTRRPPLLFSFTQQYLWHVSHKLFYYSICSFFADWYSRSRAPALRGNTYWLGNRLRHNTSERAPVSSFLSAFFASSIGAVRLSFAVFPQFIQLFPLLNKKQGCFCRLMADTLALFFGEYPAGVLFVHFLSLQLYISQERP